MKGLFLAPVLDIFYLPNPNLFTGKDGKTCRVINFMTELITKISRIFRLIIILEPTENIAMRKVNILTEIYL